MHTPGPWLRIQNGDVEDSRGNLIAAVSFQGSDGPINGHLIAAAPELLAALEAAMELGAYRGDRMPIKAVKPVFDQMKAAIAKAKGETT